MGGRDSKDHLKGGRLSRSGGSGWSLVRVRAFELLNLPKGDQQDENRGGLLAPSAYEERSARAEGRTLAGPSGKLTHLHH